ncbi:MAG: M3 family oligoendopeptidase [Ktedonobacterales bacterium]
MSATTSPTPALPRWDMTPIYSSLDSPAFTQAFAQITSDLDDLTALFGELHIERHEPVPADAEGDAVIIQTAERAIERMNAVFAHYRTVSAYISSFVATNSRDTVALARQSELQRQGVRLGQLRTRFTAWVGSLGGATLDQVIEQSTVARDHAFMLREAQTLAAHQMSPAEEALAAELAVSGGSAWGKLHSMLTSQLSLDVTLDGKPQELTMSMARNLAYDTDRERRRAGYEAELACWERNALPIAAALNGVKGQVGTLTQRRNWQTPLDAALFDARIDRETLDAMMTAAHESFPDFRRYLRAKARALGLPALAWYDIFAPVGGSGHAWAYADGAQFIVARFGDYSQKLGDFAARAFRERWIDAEPRPGKADGAFCMPVRADESRVLANFKPSFGGVSTLAHELGHAYHNLCIAGRTMLQRETPMTLAETASIFCETIVRNAALRDLAPDDSAARLEILEAALQDACQVVVDITSRFLFEQGVFERRAQRELSIDEFNSLMLEAQRATYGDGLDQQQSHPYMWAVKSHYYSVGRSFYNFPYMFGLLFGLGLYAQYQQNPDAFRANYDDLLASTGEADAATLAARFGFDIRTPNFWRSSLDIVRADIAHFEELVG